MLRLYPLCAPGLVNIILCFLYFYLPGIVPLTYSLNPFTAIINNSLVEWLGHRYSTLCSSIYLYLFFFLTSSFFPLQPQAVLRTVPSSFRFYKNIQTGCSRISPSTPRHPQSFYQHLLVICFCSSCYSCRFHLDRYPPLCYSVGMEALLVHWQLAFFHHLQSPS